MVTTPIVAALLAVLKPMSATARSREALVDMLRRAHISVTSELDLQSQVNDSQLKQFVTLLDEKPVWKVAAKRVLRGTNFES